MKINDVDDIIERLDNDLTKRLAKFDEQIKKYNNDYFSGYESKLDRYAAGRPDIQEKMEKIRKSRERKREKLRKSRLRTNISTICFILGMFCFAMFVATNIFDDKSKVENIQQLTPLNQERGDNGFKKL